MNFWFTHSKQLSELTSAAADVFTIFGLIVAAWWAYRRFRKYESRWLASEAQPALDVTVKARVLRGSTPTDRVLALMSTVTNRSKVNTTVNLDKSWFLVELASEVVQVEGTVVRGVDGKDYLVSDSLVDVATRRLRVKMSSQGPAVVRMSASLSQSSVCQVEAGIYRVTAEYQVSAPDIVVFRSLIPPEFALEEEVVWSGSTIVDAREALS